LFRGTLNRDRRVLRQRARAFTVRRANAGLIHTDGETHFAPATVDFCVLPASLRVLCP
jgi:diacylglycerol kinase family enzyme